MDPLPELRLKYSFGPHSEMQIAESYDDNGKPHLSVIYIPRSATDLWHQLVVIIASRPTVTSDEAAQLVTIKHLSVDLEPSSVLSDLLESGKAMSITLSTNPRQLIVDGAQYKLEVHSPTKDVKLILAGGAPEAAESTEPIIKWMGKVRSAVEAHLPD